MRKQVIQNRLTWKVSHIYIYKFSSKNEAELTAHKNCREAQTEINNKNHSIKKII